MLKPWAFHLLEVYPMQDISPINHSIDRSIDRINQSINESINQSINRLLNRSGWQKRSPIYKRVLRLVDIHIQLPSNKLSIVFWRKGQVVNSHSQVILVNFWRGQMLFQYIGYRLSHLTDLNKRASASFTFSAAVCASLGRYHNE